MLRESVYVPGTGCLNWKLNGATPRITTNNPRGHTYKNIMHGIVKVEGFTILPPRQDVEPLVPFSWDALQLHIGVRDRPCLYTPAAPDPFLDLLHEQTAPVKRLILLCVQQSPHFGQPLSRMGGAHLELVHKID